MIAYCRKLFCRNIEAAAIIYPSLIINNVKEAVYTALAQDGEIQQAIP
jgi:hypothetical protein